MTGFAAKDQNTCQQPNNNSAKLSICHNASSKCTTTNLKTLTEKEGNTLLGYMHSRNPKSNACAQWGSAVVVPNNSSNCNETNNNGSVSTESGNILGVSLLKDIQ